MTASLEDPQLDTLTNLKMSQDAIKKVIDISFADTLKASVQHAFDKFPYKEIFNN